MAIERLKESVDIIASLPDTPSSPEYTAESLKRKFDEGGNVIKSYINESLIPSVEDEIVATVLGEGAYKYIPTRTLLASYTLGGQYIFDTSEHESYNGIYDVVLVGGGGGGHVGDISTGGGGADACVAEGLRLEGQYNITVGYGGVADTDGSGTYFSGNGVFKAALGGQASNESRKIGKGTGIYGLDSTYGDGSMSYGCGGSCCTFGKGAVGGAIRDDMKNPIGYGGGGWGEIAGGSGAVFVYGYVRYEN